MLAWDQDHRCGGKYIPLDCEAGAGRFGKSRVGGEVQPVAGKWEPVLQPLSIEIVLFTDLTSWNGHLNNGTTVPKGTEFYSVMISYGFSRKIIVE